MKITNISPFSGKVNTREINVTQDQLDKWKAGMLIQDAMPNISPDDREFIMTGITPEEWKENFGDKEEETNQDMTTGQPEDEIDVINEDIELVVGEAYESIGTGQIGILIFADVDSDVFELSIRESVPAPYPRQHMDNTVWRGDYDLLCDEWVYVGPTIQGYDEAIENGCCKENDRPCMTLEDVLTDTRFQYLLDMVSYGLGWLKDHPENDPYRVSSLDTLAHVTACFITQKFTNCSTPTSDMVELINDFPDDEELSQRLIDYMIEQKEKE